ncbi:unnamed protein product [Pocillopora meandrina]|uniref:C2H2-type domain-containing protein n=1 Tax=Pocillopora meandrina TaxID=46732 RepID=A0AAU9WSW7_9CNID|nr:unnamed protein product [Pocillopora meandrina]
MAKMLVCAKHRHTYGKFWRQRSACQYPTHPGSDSKGAKSRYSVNLEMSKAISKMYGVLVQVGSVICINCCNKHNASVKEMPWVSLESTEKEDSDSGAYVDEVKEFRSSNSPITPSSSRLSHSTNDEMWTPSAVLALDESIEIQDFRPTRGNFFNACIDSLADAVQKPRITHLESQVNCWEKCSFTEKSEFVRKAGEACQLVCDVIAPRDGKALFQAKVCSHSHNVNCEDCEKLKSVLEEVSGVISDYTMQLGKVQAEDHLYEARNAAAKIFGWKGHILRKENQNQCKRQILDSLKGDEAFIVVDWAMKFTAMKFREKQAEWFAKRGINSHVKSDDGNDGSSYQCPEPGCDEDFKTQADLDLHMNLLVHHVSPVPASMTESLYDKVKREWVHHFQSLSLGNEISTELVVVATEPLINASQLPMGWALHKRSASVRFSQNVRQYLTQKFNIGRDTGRKQDPEQVAKDMRTACTIDGEDVR